MDRFVILSGCSGGGKSTLLSALAERGYATVEEPGRRIVERALAEGGRRDELPGIDPGKFAHAALKMALQDRADAMRLDGPVFFDRSLIDAATALHHATGEAGWLARLAAEHRYHRLVFLTPPWPEIYRKDTERQHDLAAAEAEYERLLDVYPRLGYETMMLPEASVEVRVAEILRCLQVHLQT
ncbi:AAA family ATPase [Rhizobium halophytocola]|uniref:ATPase n=1 Tax=Rhizobium halophytocola TaxID=735519 RepID=A0ABS4DSP5_9HYPH|nr:AAA family ATPase [Rhizobium halophytocola]MBP1848705.1 putative ATPase [Rhizobium halophytocola]